ncbi:MAG: hypothetical protein QF614_05785, partial [SAR324 cluster bacterium]|nr:hypothetical protein [SAR324 cluster bacterium]|tara:strand:- start:18 stop:239 length:222 start_codon:yes stop_codon:yes gene_type:complete
LSVELPQLDIPSSPDERDQFEKYVRDLSRDQIHKSLNQITKLLQIYDQTGEAPPVLQMMKAVLQAQLDSRQSS